MVLRVSSFGSLRWFLAPACLLLGLVLTTAFAPFSYYWLIIPVLGLVLTGWHLATLGAASWLPIGCAGQSLHHGVKGFFFRFTSLVPGTRVFAAGSRFDNGFRSVFVLLADHSGFGSCADRLALGNARRSVMAARRLCRIVAASWC